MASLVSGEPLRVLLVSPHAKLREEVGDALQGTGEHRFFWVSQPDLALTRAQGLAPHLVLVDDDLTGAGTAEGATDPVHVAGLVRRLAEGLPESAILLLASPGSLNIAQAAVLAGARAFIPKPVKGDELIPVLRQVLSHRVANPRPVEREAPTGRVVVFCGPKGGTGRTTMAINTAISLREITRQPVVIVDADYAAPAIDVALNLKGQRDIRDLLPKLNQLDADLISSVLATHNSGVRVLLAPPPDALEYPPTLPQVQQVTAWLKRTFPWVLIDLGLPLDEAAYAFLDGADRVVMSVLPEMVGMRNAKLMLAQFDKRNYPPGKVWPLLNRDGLPGGIKKPDAQAYLGRELAFAIPNDQELATETINRGVPMVIAHRRRPVAQAYRRLSSLLADDRKQGETVQAAAALVAAGAPAVPATGAPAGANARPAGASAPRAAAAGGARSGPTGAAPTSQLPGPTTAASQPRRKMLLAGIAVLLVLLILLVAGPLALRAINGGSAPPPSPTPESAALVASAASPPAMDGEVAATRSAASTRTAETLARLLAGSATPEDEWPPGQEGTAATAGAVQLTPATGSPALPSPAPTSTPPPSPAPTRTPVPSATATSTDTPAPAPTYTPEPSATPTPTAMPTATAMPTRTPTRRPTATRPQPTPVATATPARFAGSVSPPALIAPDFGQAVAGVVTFAWLPTGPLPAGAKYEVVWWNVDEAAEAARGVAPPTTGTSLSADLAPLFNTGQARSSQLFWSVIEVLEGPYQRLVSPADSERGAFYYSPPPGP